MLSNRHNQKRSKQLPRAFRKNQTDAEGKLWQQLRNKQIEGYKFYRQYSIGKYILDFYCPRKRLAIELDGDQHAYESSRESDKNRSEFLKTQRIKAVRFWNNEIYNNLDGILFKIREELGLDN